MKESASKRPKGAEVVAARQVEPRVIVRPGIGQVLGVR